MGEQPDRIRLRVLPGGGATPSRPPVPDALVERAVVAVVVSSGGIPRRMLVPAVTSWLEIRRPGEELPAPDLVLRSLGMCMVRGEVDSRGDRLVPGPAITEHAV